MKYISAEQFSEQPKEVQKVFLDWWRPHALDIFQYKDHRIRLVDNGSSNITIITIEDSFTSYPKYDCIPLFIEGQLRRFIEDKMNCIMDIDANIDSGYSLYLYFLEFDEFSKESRFASKIKIYEDLGKDLFQAYWKVACEVAKDSLKIN